MPLCAPLSAEQQGWAPHRGARGSLRKGQEPRSSEEGYIAGPLGEGTLPLIIFDRSHAIGLSEEAIAGLPAQVPETGHELIERRR